LLENSVGGFSLIQEHEAMTVVTLASRRAAPAVPCVHTPAHPTTPAQATQPAHELHLIQLHAQACNSLREALRQLQSLDERANMWTHATCKAHRALSTLKQASALAHQAGG
jgi:uncharacterized NAD(P)/FAD-binding protein YdhS